MWYYLNFTQKYFFRHTSLRHLRVEQFNRYLYMAGENDSAMNYTAEDTVNDVDEDAPPVDIYHRNYDEFMETIRPGAHFLSNAQHVPGCKRRVPARLGVSRVPFIEPIGASREAFYESKLALGLAWYCDEKPSVAQDPDGKAVTQWTFKYDPPGAQLESITMKLGLDSVSFEVVCNRLERRFCDAELNLVCKCCTEELRDSVCRSCLHATGFHLCRNPNNERPDTFLWRKGTLHAGVLDVQRVLFNLHRKLLPTTALEEKADEYLAAGLISSGMAKRVIECIKQERGTATYLNDGVSEVTDENADGNQSVATKLSPAAMQALLNKRVNMMQSGAHDGGATDQFRVYQEIIQHLEHGDFLRSMVQASAGASQAANAIHSSFKAASKFW